MNKVWALPLVVRVVDGDSVIAHIERVLDDDGDREIVERQRRARLRLVTLDTPERGEVGWAEARADVVSWLSERYGNLEVETYGRDSFGRFLADIYEKGARQNTLTQYMLLRGWDAYHQV